MSKNPIDKLTGYCVVTGASSGIGLELAKLAAKDGCALLLVADRDLTEAENAAKQHGASDVETLKVDLGTKDGVETLAKKIGNRPVDALIANAGHGLGDAFLTQEWDDIAHVIDTNVKGTVSLIHKLGAEMVLRNEGRILVTGSIAGDMPGSYQLVYNSTKAFVNDFCVGLANELKNTEVVVSCLMPGVTDTQFFERADMEDTQAGQMKNKADPAKVARDGYDALLRGETQEVSGFMNKVQDVFAGILPDELVAKMHRRLAKPE
ncbi:SDR family NAD(P)-dependent oxidoreductase [Qipengyuania atrilutea]|uniref:SDR family NAD(P)-dependent oxidoreductase n=1 Tax=Qipengyuania atrilutea TaxID=2744473 RepID=A0A850H4B1_9SPHN|nr:SDR family NAD(P)-dependent oxidoreductase [Actirhodobacter atriluteus]NVD44738.1 SDR family NAD(P)-dependent oxidoreductase [Actirhodobacter atriluteus]